MWPPAIPKAYLDAAAERALAFQRTAFLRMLRPQLVLQPLDPNDELKEATIQRLKAKVEQKADVLIQKHANELPDCPRAAGHLQVAAPSKGQRPRARRYIHRTISYRQ